MQDLTKPNIGSGPSINPFRDDVFSPLSPIPGTPQIHQEEMSHCVQAIERMVAGGNGNQAHGELISISSPIAGYGKSHLINRISKTVLNSVSTIELAFGTGISWKEWFAMTAQHLDSTVSQVHSDSSLLDEAGAKFLSNLIGTAVAQGVIEERDCPVSLSTLQTDYCEAFNEGARSKLLVWLKKKIAVITTATQLSPIEFAGFSKGDVAHWADYFLTHFRDEESGFGTTNRLTDIQSRDRLLQLLRIASNCRPLLIVADHLDYCHGSKSAGIELAATLTAIVERVAKCVLIISMNGDLWQSTFENRLPSALLDRINRDRVELSAVGINEAKELIVNRLCAGGVTYNQSHQFANVVSDDFKWEETEDLFPRQILRQAKELWQQRGTEFHQSTPAESAAFTQPIDSQYQAPDQSTSFHEYLHPGANPQPPLYAEATNQTPNPFEGHAMSYPDRPAPTAPVCLPGEPVDFRNQAPVGQEPQQTAAPFPYPQDQPTAPAQNRDEPNPAPGNVKMNGNVTTPIQSVNGASTVVKNKAIDPKVIEQMENYFGQLEQHYGKRAGELTLDFPELESLVKSVGEAHPPITQSEVEFPGGQTSSLNWGVPNYQVWIGFEPARNIYFYSNVLQKQLGDREAVPGKIVCFSHDSQPFDRELLTTNGITPELLKGYFDFIQLSDAEMVIVKSASQFLKETSEKGYREAALDFLIKRLSPLWQRLCQPLGN